MVADAALTEVEVFKNNVIVDNSTIATTTVRTAHLKRTISFLRSIQIDMVKFINAQRKLCDYVTTSCDGDVCCFCEDEQARKDLRDDSDERDAGSVEILDKTSVFRLPVTSIGIFFYL